MEQRDFGTTGLRVSLLGLGDSSASLLHSVRDAHAVRETIESSKREVQTSREEHHLRVLFAVVVVGRSLQELIGLNSGEAPLLYRFKRRV